MTVLLMLEVDLPFRPALVASPESPKDSSGGEGHIRAKGCQCSSSAPGRSGIGEAFPGSEVYLPSLLPLSTPGLVKEDAPTLGGSSPAHPISWRLLGVMTIWDVKLCVGVRGGAPGR